MTVRLGPTVLARPSRQTTRTHSSYIGSMSPLSAPSSSSFSYSSSKVVGIPQRQDSVVQWLSSHHLFHLKSHTLNYLSINLSFATPFRAVPWLCDCLIFQLERIALVAVALGRATSTVIGSCR